MHRGGLVWLEGPRAAPLGVFEDTVFKTQRRMLASNETLIVYSDGVSESMNAQAALFGSDGIQRCLQGLALNHSEDAVKRIVAAVQAHQGDAPQADDITLVALRPMR